MARRVDADRVATSPNTTSSTSAAATSTPIQSARLSHRRLVAANPASTDPLGVLGSVAYVGNWRRDIIGSCELVNLDRINQEDGVLEIGLVNHNKVMAFSLHISA
jgi:hypothetical protein